MTRRIVQSSPSRDFWELVGRQHGVVSRPQLLKLGLSSEAIAHRIATGRLHRTARGVYAVGRPELSSRGRWMTAVLICGPSATLSHRSVARLWGIVTGEGDDIEVTVAPQVRRRRAGLRIYRQLIEPDDAVVEDGIPATAVRRTLLDLATVLRSGRLEAAISEADKLDLIDPASLRMALGAYSGRPGVAALRAVLDRHTFALTDSALERRFLAIVRSAGLPLPETGVHLNGFKVDFHWPDLGLVVETDGLRYHRTPGQQARDRLRDQAHAAAGLAQLRFTHAQVYHEAAHVKSTLLAVAARIRHG